MTQLKKRMLDELQRRNYAQTVFNTTWQASLAPRATPYLRNGRPASDSGHPKSLFMVGAQ